LIGEGKARGGGELPLLVSEGRRAEVVDLRSWLAGPLSAEWGRRLDCCADQRRGEDVVEPLMLLELFWALSVSLHQSWG